MAYDFKKEQKELYRPGKRPAIIKVPPMNYLAVQGKGDYQIPGYFDFVVPPLEGMW
ncbi:hypothetical protein FC58_GL001531 [Limosilactobacillus vaginalis DSM 5837 = ATCC 49540]|jgi:hypothetical protein|uniref:Uncharacterized protein n=2 Tax=Limosilactobacillus vaginalis TaxID=1633 RepID=C2EV06_9LACO|nr:hypothetical protein HMPREF0549_1292 [Limosilactobacillus vaginalis DSM 5837 = ATCC 49540]KRM44212.1 hypothetical protein FC58_GL001531 [Limosilactobacillus vaginalis DSM 5837 = ATCC 49540]